MAVDEGGRLSEESAIKGGMNTWLGGSKVV